MRQALSAGLMLLAYALLPQTALAKDWRGIVPLKSTRADVERRFGKPDEWGGYNLKNERVSFNYGDGPCKGVYLKLGSDNCKCLAPEDAVMSIFVEPTGKQKVSDLRLDLTKFTRTPIRPFPHTFEYNNIAEGIAYTVDESENEVMHIDYYPSEADCKDIISKRAPEKRNSWRGLVPLISKRADVERVLGSPNRDWTTQATYETDYESVVATYSTGVCDPPGRGWNVPKGTLLELVVNPNPSFFLKELQLESSWYVRSEISPYPEIENPPKVWIYSDKKNGITIRTQSSVGGGGGEELVVGITYLPAQRDEKLRCRAAP